MAIRFSYKGDGSFLPGIPSRDLTDDDLAALTPEQRADVDASTLYEAIEKKSKPSTATSGEA